MLNFCYFVKYFQFFIFFRGIKLPGVEKAVRGRGGRAGSTQGRGKNSGRSRKQSPRNSTTSTVEEDDPLGTTPEFDEDDTPPPPPPQPIVSLRNKQTAKHGKPFGTASRQPLGVKKCSVNIQRQDEENVKPKPKIEKPPGKSPVTKKGNKKEGTKKTSKEKEKKETEKEPVKEDVNEDDKEMAEKPQPKREIKKQEKPEIPKNDTQNRDSKTEKQETVSEKPKARSTGTEKKTFHMETAMVMDSDPVENIRKDSMEVIGDSLRIKNLEDQIEGMLTTRTQVKDTQKRIQVLESILKSLKKEAVANDEKDRLELEKKYIKSQEEKDPKARKG